MRTPSNAPKAFAAARRALMWWRVTVIEERKLREPPAAGKPRAAVGEAGSNPSADGGELARLEVFLDLGLDLVLGGPRVGRPHPEALELEDLERVDDVDRRRHGEH